MATYFAHDRLENPELPFGAGIKWGENKFHERGIPQVFYFDLDVAELIAAGRVPATGLVANDIVELSRLPVGARILYGRLAWDNTTWGSDDPTAVIVDVRTYVPGTTINNPGTLVAGVNLMSGSSGDFAQNLAAKMGMRVGQKLRADEPHDPGYLNKPAAIAIRMATVTTAGNGSTVGTLRGWVLAMGMLDGG